MTTPILERSGRRSARPSDEQHLAPAVSLLEVTGGAEVTAVKRAEDRDELVVRLLNESPTTQRASVRPHRTPARAQVLNLAEEPGHEIPIVDGRVELELRPWQLATIGFEFPS